MGDRPMPRTCLHLRSALQCGGAARWCAQNCSRQIAQIHETMVAIAKDKGVVEGRKMRVDTTMVDAAPRNATKNACSAAIVMFSAFAVPQRALRAGSFKGRGPCNPQAPQQCSKVLRVSRNGVSVMIFIQPSHRHTGARSIEIEERQAVTGDGTCDLRSGAPDAVAALASGGSNECCAGGTPPCAGAMICSRR